MASRAEWFHRQCVAAALAQVVDQQAGQKRFADARVSAGNEDDARQSGLVHGTELTTGHCGRTQPNCSPLTGPCQQRQACARAPGCYRDKQFQLPSIQNLPRDFHWIRSSLRVALREHDPPNRPAFRWLAGGFVHHPYTARTRSVHDPYAIRTRCVHHDKARGGGLCRAMLMHARGVQRACLCGLECAAKGQTSLNPRFRGQHRQRKFTSLHKSLRRRR